jgi:hypothetical protein
MFGLLQIGSVIFVIALTFEVFRLRTLCNELRRNSSMNSTTIRTQRIVLTDGTGTERYTIALAESAKRESIEKLFHSLNGGTPPELPPQLEIRAGDTAVLAIHDRDSINFYDGRTVLYPNGLVLGNAELPGDADLKDQVDILREGGAPAEYWLSAGGSAKCGSIGVLFNERNEPEVWMLHKGEREPQSIEIKPPG